MRIVCISDTHGLHRNVAVPYGDLLVHAGDLTRRGELDELRDLNDWLGTLPHPRKLLVAGNHDRICEEVPELLPALFSHATYLVDSAVEIGGLTFYGSPWHESFPGMAFHLGPTARQYAWAQIPAGVDVLITHGPPLGAHDRTYRGQHVGCPYLAEAVLRVRPQLHVFGHIHEAHGVTASGGITFVNASICDLRYAAVHEPIVIDIP
jgi:Icc-related predicted phosphoesterase